MVRSHLDIGTGTDKTNKTDRTDGTDKIQRTDWTDRTDETDKTDRMDKTNKTDRTDGTDKTNKTNKTNNYGRCFESVIIKCMKTLREIINEADSEKTAIGHFNISDTEMLKGVFVAARNFNKPIIIGVSEGERDFIGIHQIAAFIKSLREEYNFPIFLNADHTYSFERVKEAIDAGYDAVIFDGAKLPFEENLEITKKCVEYAKSVSPNILVEGELGYIGKSSKLLDEIPEDVEITDEHLTMAEEIEQFVKKTGIDLIAPAVGNLHGMLKHMKNPNLNIKRIKELREASGVPMVLHGGSGVSDDDFVKAIDAGISVIHISTEIRAVYKNGIKTALQEDTDEIAPYRYMKDAVHNVEKIVKQRLMLFNKT